MKKIAFPGFDGFQLKIIAIVTMLIDHTGVILFPGRIWFRIIGRTAFPIFAFMIAEGYLHTRNPWKYLARLLLFAVVSQVPYSLMGNRAPLSLSALSIYCTLALGLVAIIAYEKMKGYLLEHRFHQALSVGLSLILPAVCIWLGEKLHVDYAWRGVALIFAFHFARTNWQAVLGVLALLTVYEWPALMSGRINQTYLGLFLPMPLLFLYNGRKGISMKYLFYLFYPAHILILVLIKRVFF